MKAPIVLVGFITAIATCRASAGGAELPVDLRCDGMSGIPAVAATPGLSWRIESDQRGVSQSAWQILVASSDELLREDRGDLWDSGRQPATRSYGTIYQGRGLSSGQRCFWKVRAWDQHGGVSNWSATACWQVAPMKPADWHGARWIDDGGKVPDRDEDFYQPDPAPLFRKEFQVEKPVLRATLHVAGLGWCVSWLNGSRAGDHVLDPPWTRCDKRVLFSTHDVTGAIVKGNNCLGFELGNGWFNPLPLRMWGRKNIRDALPTGRPGVIACLIVEHPDGTSTRVTTGGDWTQTRGWVLSNSIYLGEVRDLRLSVPGWNRPGYDARTWQAARVATASLDILEPLACPPIRTGTPVPPVRVTRSDQGVHLVDFGKNFTCIPEIRLRAPKGTRVTFRYGEILNADGSLNPLTSVCGQIKDRGKGKSTGGPGAPLTAWQQDVCICAGEDGEVFRPGFTFHAFRYMEITGLPDAPKPDDIRAIPVHSDLRTTGSFSCSNERINRIQSMCLNTFLSNVVGVQSDCPHRERFGYGGDIAATSEAFMMNFDMSGFYQKVVRDWADSADGTGHMPDTAPGVGIDYCGVGWSMVHPLLLEQLHRHYGNIRLVREQFPLAMKWLENEASRRVNGLVTGGLSDHESLNKSGGPSLTTPMFVDAARRVGRLARCIGREENAARCEVLARESSDAWLKEFVDPASGQVGDGSQTSQLFALGFDITPENLQSRVFDRLMASIRKQDKPALTTGIFGTRFLMEELSRRGEIQTAYQLADRNTFPSWGWMLENDATTLWEHWAGSDDTFSHNHPMFGSVSGWFYRWLGGIQAADDAVAFDRIVIRPQVVPGLTWTKCSHRSARGLIESNWSVTPAGTIYQITVPPDTEAVVSLPSCPDGKLSEKGQPLQGLPGIRGIETSPVATIIRLGGGRYEFLAERP